MESVKVLITRTLRGPVKAQADPKGLEQIYSPSAAQAADTRRPAVLPPFDSKTIPWKLGAGLGSGALPAL